MKGMWKLALLMALSGGCFLSADVAKKRCCIRLSQPNVLIRRLAQTIGFDLDFSGWMRVGFEYAKERENQRQVLKRLFDVGTDWCIYLTPMREAVKGVQQVQINVVQAWSGVSVLRRSAAVDDVNMVWQGHEIAGALLDCLVGKRGLCTSTLAWCQGNAVYCSDYACQAPRKVVTTPGTKFALSFHSKVPMLFYSQTTDRNGELCAVNLATGKQRILFSYPGLTMQFSMSRDGFRGVTCMSGGKPNTELFLYDQAKCNQLKKKVFAPLTQNGGTNASPCYLPNGDVVFCSDFQTGKSGRPQLYYLDVRRRKTMRLTDGLGFCAAPHYCAANNSIAFNKEVRGVFQVFKMDLSRFDPTTFKEGCGLEVAQLTMGPGHKMEPQWHESGDYLLFVLQQEAVGSGRDGRLAILNLVDGVTRLLPVKDPQCGFPAWTQRRLF